MGFEPKVSDLSLRVIEEFQARGHRNILAMHPMTFEITKDSEVSRRGDCVVAVGASKGLLDLSTEFRTLCRSVETRIKVEFETGGIVEAVEGRGSPALTYGHATEIVGRKSTYVSNRTLMIRANRAACDFRRDLVRLLQFPETRVHVRLIAEL